MTPRRLLFPALLIGAAVAFGACTGGSSPSAAASTAASAAPSESAGASAEASGSPGASTAAIAAPTSLITPGTLVDCVDIEYPPMEYFPTAGNTDPSTAVGFDVDGARAVAKALGLTLQVRNTAFDALIPDLQAGRCDIVWTALYLSAKRLAVADGVPYMATGQVVMVPTGNPKGIKSLTDLCGKSVSIQSGGVVEQRINQASKDCTSAGQPAINIQGYPKVADEFQQIVLGRVDAVWETDTAVSDWMRTNPGKYEVGYALPKTDTYGVYFQKGHADIGTALTAALQATKADGSLAALATQYSIDPVTLDAIK